MDTNVVVVFGGVSDNDTKHLLDAMMSRGLDDLMIVRIRGHEEERCLFTRNEQPERLTLSETEHDTLLEERVDQFIASRFHGASLANVRAILLPIKPDNTYRIAMSWIDPWAWLIERFPLDIARYIVCRSNTKGRANWLKSFGTDSTYGDSLPAEMAR
jgi:hypothetical protein